MQISVSYSVNVSKVRTTSPGASVSVPATSLLVSVVSAVVVSESDCKAEWEAAYKMVPERISAEMKIDNGTIKEEIPSGTLISITESEDDLWLLFVFDDVVRGIGA